MSDNDLMTMYESSLFRKLAKDKNSFSLILTIIILGLYFGFISAAAFFPDILARTVLDGALSIGLVGGVMIIFSAIFLTGLYVWNANAKFDPVVAKLIEEAGK